jgi:glycerol 3-phosphatase-2
VQDVVAIDEQPLEAVGGLTGSHDAVSIVRATIATVLLLVDLDGVVYRGPRPVPGMPELLTERASAGDIIVYVTNNSRWHRDDYLERLEGMGAPVSPDRIVTAARGTALALAERVGPDRRAMVFGGPGLAREMRDVGLRTVAATEHGLSAQPDTLVAGVDFGLTYVRLSIAAEVIRGGAYFAATNRDPVFPVPDRFRAGAGALIAALVVAGGREPDLVVGKPEPGLFRQAAALVGMPVEEAVVIGDGLGTDILAATRVGARSVLMLTGVSTVDQAQALPEAQRPDHIVADPAALRPLLEELAG